MKKIANLLVETGGWIIFGGMPKPNNTARQNHDSNYDEPWKSFIINNFRLFLALFFPEMARAVNWAVPPVFDSPEVSQSLGKAKRLNKFIDVIVKV